MEFLCVKKILNLNLYFLTKMMLINSKLTFLEHTHQVLFKIEIKGYKSLLVKIQHRTMMQKNIKNI